ncbi:PDZ domain-containing protein [bacterium]|nr:PDZ domain-containing protein [bacterium]MBU1990704.1 PDZ domain-containing protein [bacterium]
MLRVFFALNILLLHLYACKGGYDSCKSKITDSKAIVGQTLQIPISKNQRLIFSKQTPNAKIIKHDPFLSLYLVEDTNSFKYPFALNPHLSLGKAAVNQTSAIEGKISKKQVGLNRLAAFNEAVFTPSMLLNSCCSLEGMITEKGIIQKEYIQRFLHSGETDYSDIGIRIDLDTPLLVVKSIDPFFKNNPFKKGDRILEYDGKKVKNKASFMQRVLFSKTGVSHKVKIKRGSQNLALSVISQKRYGGGYISDTFLEQKGIYFDENLSIVKILEGYKDYGLNIGDKLLKVNADFVENQQDVMNTISDFKDFATLLFEREKFQFFVQIN